jgi:hypothetical protein
VPITWAALIKAVYEVDPLKCPKCGGTMKIVSFVEEAKINIAIITMILKFPSHIFLSSCAGYFTLGKWVFMWFCMGLVIIGSAMALFKRNLIER